MSFTKLRREEIFQKCNGHCAYCGEILEFTKMQIDHIIPQYNFINDVINKWRIPSFLTHLKFNEYDHIDNLMPSCRVCNKWKSAFDLEYFRNEIFQQIRRLNEKSSNYRMAKRFGLVIESAKPIIFYFETIKQPSIHNETKLLEIE